MLDKLPIELVQYVIYPYLDLVSKANLAKTCKKFYDKLKITNCDILIILLNRELYYDIYFDSNIDIMERFTSYYGLPKITENITFDEFFENSNYGIPKLLQNITLKEFQEKFKMPEDETELNTYVIAEILNSNIPIADYILSQVSYNYIYKYSDNYYNYNNYYNISEILWCLHNKDSIEYFINKFGITTEHIFQYHCIEDAEVFVNNVVVKQLINILEITPQIWTDLFGYNIQNYHFFKNLI